ncbi:hypothetical protein AAG906_005324 [Vitis piasezkii]
MLESVYSVITILFVFVACVELCDAVTVVDVYHLIQYDLIGVHFGSRLPNLNHHATSGLGPALMKIRATFPLMTPPGANFYPPDMDKMEFELWKGSLAKDKQEDATGFFNVIRRHSEFMLDISLSNNTVEGTDDLVGSTHDYIALH